MMESDPPILDHLGFFDNHPEDRPPDPVELDAKTELRAFIEQNKEHVFFPVSLRSFLNTSIFIGSPIAPFAI
jgi:hypothetical protein